jgi:hypothetical protein
VPPSFKEAYITPLLKKPDLDPTDVKSYRPISNLSVLSKLLERLVARQLLDYLNTEGLMPRLQSAYRAHHSTETAIVKVMSDILLALDSSDLAMLTLLDLSAAFDTVDHTTLLRRLAVSYGLGGSVLGLVFIISHGPEAVRPSWCLQIDPNRSAVWSSAGVGSRTDTISALHSRSTSACGATRPSPAPVCRRHADLWLLLTRNGSAAAAADIRVCR